MSIRPPWSYVQARLQARHGERLDETGWRALEAARSLDQFIERSRATSLRRFTVRLNAGMSNHAIERALRAAWRDYVTEIAGWSTQDWRLAIAWLVSLPDLPAIEALLKGEAPDWTEQDPLLAVFLGSERRTGLANSSLEALLPGPKREPTLAKRWYARWRVLWPKSATELGALKKLSQAVNAHVERLERAGVQDASVPHRRDLAQTITRMFRWGGGTPVAAFCHLALVGLDLERLRGGLVRRALFAAAKEAV